jgi:hypothetical protein
MREESIAPEARQPVARAYRGGYPHNFIRQRSEPLGGRFSQINVSKTRTTPTRPPREINTLPFSKIAPNPRFLPSPRVSSTNRTAMLIGYARVSTQDQSLDLLRKARRSTNPTTAWLSNDTTEAVRRQTHPGHDWRANERLPHPVLSTLAPNRLRTRAVATPHPPDHVLVVEGSIGVLAVLASCARPNAHLRRHLCLCLFTLRVWRKGT